MLESWCEKFVFKNLEKIVGNLFRIFTVHNEPQLPDVYCFFFGMVLIRFGEIDDRVENPASSGEKKGVVDVRRW